MFCLEKKKKMAQLFDLALKIIPEYSGDANSLYRFLNAGDHIFSQYFDVQNVNNFQNIITINAIIGKLKGKALEIIDVNAVNSWPAIKQVLIQNFSDQRDENSLNRDLVNLHQGNESPQQFYDKCLNLLTTLINYINIHNDDENVIACKRDFFTAQALKTFLAGLREPLGSTIRAMRPESLPKALQYIKEENNIMYLQKRNQPLLNNNSKQINQNPNQNFKFNNAPRFPPNWFQQRSNGNMNFNPNRSNWNNNNQQHFRQPNLNQFRNQNQQNKYNYFYQDPKRNPKPRPTPMSGISYPNAQPNNNNSPRFIPNPNYKPQQLNSQNPNYFQNVGHYPDFVFEELNHNEINNAEFVDQNYTYSEYGCDYDNNFEPEFISVPYDDSTQGEVVTERPVTSNTPENQNFQNTPDQDNVT